MPLGRQAQTLILPADTAVLDRVGALVEQAARESGFDERSTGDLMLVVDEACTNTITHGLKRDASRTFQIEVGWRPGEIDITIREDGEPFDPTKVPIPDTGAGLEERPIGGLGVYFMRTLMDEVSFHTEAKGMKVLRMVKRMGQNP